MTRALGDLPLKVSQSRDWRVASVNEQVVTALPDVHVVRRQCEDLCVVIASDGLFGSVMSSAEVRMISPLIISHDDETTHDPP